MIEEMTDSTHDTSESLTHDDAVDLIADLVDDDLLVSNEAPEEPKAKAEPETDEESDDDYLADVDDEDEEDGDTPEETSEAEEDDDSEEGESEEITLTVDGEEITTTLDELKKGYSRQSDYTKKTQELAEQRKAMDNEAKTLEYLKVQRDFQPKVIELNSLQKQIAEAEEALHTGYTADGHALTRDNIHDTEENVKEAKRKLAYETKQINEKMAQTPPPGLEELREKVPAYFSEDAEAFKVVKEQHMAIMGDFGFSNVEVQSVSDPRTILMLEELRGLRELQSRVDKAKARKSGKTGVVSKSTKSTPTRSKSTKRKASSAPKDYTSMADQFGSEDFNMEDFLGDVL